MKIFTKIICSRSRPTEFIEPALNELSKEVSTYMKKKDKKNVTWLQSLSKDQLVLTAIVG